MILVLSAQFTLLAIALVSSDLLASSSHLLLHTSGRLASTPTQSKGERERGRGVDFEVEATIHNFCLI